ncbi:Peptidase M1, alanine aminopeptidase/leukotriene A4 hydrolase [Trema orientale]|uniref:Aminopeptidase n=1 Tax=Trema orientale TaxID=63057 RepID=A0A2P5FDW2_TREOI|nr:Peptidase M1, alanine aminopeptidase/leukotriene A4 hydrolase [Trema orientale]
MRCPWLALKPDLRSCKFTGSVAIDLDVVADTRFIVLNAAKLSVNTSSISFTTGKFSKRLQRRGNIMWSILLAGNIIWSITTAISNFFRWFLRDRREEIRSSGVFKPSKVEIFEEDEILVLEFSKTLPIGEGVLAIAFEGVLNDEMKGFYRSTYEHNGEKKNMAVSQFEPADARQCFPCWDEPACKATFKITLDVPSDLVALSNMPVIDEKVNGKIKTVSYQETPIMSTYLVAFVVGLLDYVEDHTSDGVKVRVYCQVGKTDQGKFALHVAVKTLELYKEYFDVPYSLPKLDMVAIPDFAFGAMENYGLVTYRETALLYDDQHSAAANKQRVATVIAHELAHQWFGNLVTMEWWTHLWLNEGFATWVSYLATDSLFPEWKVWTQFLDESIEGLRLDSLEGSHPIEVEVKHASEIDEIFDAISYKKGASVIRMLQSYIGAECFQWSLALYIERHASSNAKTEDLWAALEEGSGEPVNRLMNSWTKQKGYPVVSVKVKDQKLEFEQSQFLLSGSHGDGRWIVPITLCRGSYDNRKSFLLETESGTLDMNEFSLAEAATGAKGDGNSPSHSWIKVNVDQTGFYRVKYDEDLAARLRYAVENKYLSATDRNGILDDSFALCMARQQSFISLLTLMSSYGEELDYTVLSNLITVSYRLERIVADAVPELLDSIKQFFITLFKNSAEKLGWQPRAGESHLDAMLRGEVLNALAVYGHDQTLNEASRRFNVFLHDRNTPLLPPDLRKATYVAVMQRTSAVNRSGYESLLRIYRESDLSQEKTRILSSLASCPDPSIVLEVLNYLLSAEVRSQDVVLGLAVSKEGRETAWTWLKDNWEYISKTWGSGFLITRFINAIVSPFASIEKAEEIEEFFASRTKPSMVRTLKQSIERVHINASWVQSVQSEEHLDETLDQLTYYY